MLGDGLNSHRGCCTSATSGSDCWRIVGGLDMRTIVILLFTKAAGPERYVTY